VPRSCEEKVFALMQGGSKTTESESDSALDSARLPVSERRDYLEEDERVIESERNRRAVPFCILSSKPHGNKLRTGHLRGNRFSIVVRDVHENGLNIANEVATRLTAAGFPNYYGEQRFGHDGETLNLGIDLLAGRKQPRDIPFAKRKFLLRLAVSAVQSELFNRSLAQRMSDGLLQTVLPGDVMEVVESGGRFVVEDVSREQERLNRGEIVVTGPMFGVKMLNPQSAAAEREAKLLLESGLTIEQFQQFSQLMQGTRRPYVIRPGELKVSGDDRLIKLEFALPSGVYATTLLREIMKPPQAV
jgi:tRNA pseudouridine13 synthase